MKCEKPRLFKNCAGLLPCGICRPCRINYRRDKVTRISLEAAKHDENLWITLTYAPEHLPVQKIRKDGRSFGSKDFPTLWRPDCQNFFKRLRNYGLPEDFKYFLVGEYGEKFHRPHYHACLFGIGEDHKDRILRAWSLPNDQGSYSPIGHIYFGRLEPHSIQYTAGYTVKKMTSFNHEDLHGRYPEFSASSKGLSLSAVDDVIAAMSDLRLNDLPGYLIVNGRKVPVPRYIKNKVRERLGIIPDQEDWKNELYALRTGQISSPENVSLSDYYQKAKRQTLLNQSAKLKLFFEKEKLL